MFVAHTRAACRRFASTSRACATVRLPIALTDQLRKSGEKDVEEVMSAKGPVFSTSVVGGTMAAKRASEFVPLHTPSGLVENCTFNISLSDTFEEVRIQCDATVSSGSADIESLTGATTAALTVYDMCKSVSKEGLYIGKIEVVDSSQEAAPPVSSAPKATPAPTPTPTPTPTRQQQQQQQQQQRTESVATPVQDEPVIKSRRGSAGGSGSGSGSKKGPATTAENTAVRDKLTELIEQIQMEEAAHRSGN